VAGSDAGVRGEAGSYLMPVYVYGCNEKNHPRVEVVHGIDEDPAVLCECGAVMHRVPQLFSWGWDAGLMLYENMDDEYRAFRKGGRRGVTELHAKQGERVKSAFEIDDR
jgi:hypothetical protein